MTTYFNWSEFKQGTNLSPESVIILAHCLTKGYNKIIADSGPYLLKVLKINKISQDLFKNGYLGYYRNKIISTYKCREPQSYFINNKFLISNCDVRHKMNYLYLLSHRPISNKNNYIPDYFVEERFWNNLFIRSQNNNLYFIPEINKTNEFRTQNKGEHE